ncbi:MAG: T9SS type A sorting domain-containing protein, partial [Bacteroidota bacterium]
YAGSGYPDDQPGPVATDPWCLNDGCYTYYIMDSYGDGLLGGFWCGQDGSVSVVFNGDTLGQITEAQADFGDQTSFQFCIGNVGLEWSVIKDVEVYPNPFTNSIQINLNQIEATDIILTDIAGKEFLRKVVTGNKIQLELGSELSTGTYLIQIKMKDGSTITKKVNKI